MSQRLQLGSVGFNGEVLPFSLSRQTPPALQTGPAIQRAGRQGVTTLVFDDFSKGFLPVSGVARWDQSKGRVYYNQGIMLHLPGLACLPFASTAQTNLQIAGPTSIDISGYRAANKRVHSIMSSLGSSSGGRFYAFLGPNMYKDTSTSNAALVAPSTADNLSDNVTSVWAGRANATDYLIVGTDGTTNDTRGTTDPTANDVSWTEILTHAHADDQIEAGWYFPQWDYNVVMGTLNQLQGMWSFPGGAATLPYTSSSVTPVVITETKDQANPNSTIYTYGPFYARSFTADTDVGVTVTNLPNLGADDGSYATFSCSGTPSAFITARDFALDYELPASFRPTGMLVEIQGIESLGSADAYISSINLELGGFAKTQTLSGSTEFPTSEGSPFQFGGSQDRWGGPMHYAGITGPGNGVKFTVAHANAVQTVSLDYIRVYPSGIHAGTQVMFSAGACGFGNNPASATQRIILAPSRSEPAAVTVEREAWLLDFAFDIDRITVQPTKPATGMPHVEGVCHHQGGYAIWGGSAPGPAELAKIIDSNGVTRSLGFPQVNGSTAVRVVDMFSANTALMAWVANADNTDCQLWIFIDGAWNAYGALFSKTLAGTMGAFPLAYAERTMGTTNKQIYCFYPTSSNTSVIRQFVPTDVLTDPFLTNTTQVKQDGPLYFETLELDVMPEEALKAFTGMEVQSRRVDDNTSYGSVNWKVDTGGDHAFGSAEIDQTFDAAAETYTLRAFSSSNDPGVAYRTAIFRCTLNHQSGTAETPNALPTIFYIAADWPFLQRFSIILDTENQTEGPVALAARLEALFTTKNVQAFNGNGQYIPVKLDLERGGYEITYKATTLGKMQPTWADVQKFAIHLQELQGAVAA